MKKVGEVHTKGLKIPVFISEFVDKDHLYLMNPKSVYVMDKFNEFRPLTRRMKFKDYFKNLWKAIRGKS